MSKNGVKIRKDPGVFTHLPPQRINEIRSAVKAALISLSTGDIKTYEQIIEHANTTLTKHEKGIFSGFALSKGGA